MRVRACIAGLLQVIAMVPKTCVLIEPPRRRTAPRQSFNHARNARYYLPLLAGDGVEGAGAIGEGEVVPEPVVDGGIVLRGALLPVVIGDEDGPLFAVVPLLFQPAMTMKPIKASTARPAIQPHHPPTASSRRSTGSLNRGSVYRGSSHGVSSIGPAWAFERHPGSPTWMKPFEARACGSEKFRRAERLCADFRFANQRPNKW